MVRFDADLMRLDNFRWEALRRSRGGAPPRPFAALGSADSSGRLRKVIERWTSAARLRRCCVPT